MRKMPPFFPIYPTEFMTDPKFAFLDNEALGAVFRLLCWQWQCGSVPCDEAKLAQICNCDKVVISRLYPAFKVVFNLVISPQEMANAWLDGHRKNILSKRERMSDGGKRGMSARWDLNKVVITTDTDTDKKTKKKEKKAFGNSFFKIAYSLWKQSKGLAPTWDHKIVASVFESLKDRLYLKAEWAGYLAYSNKYRPKYEGHDPLKFKEWLSEVYTAYEEETCKPVVDAMKKVLAEESPPPYWPEEENRFGFRLWAKRLVKEGKVKCIDGGYYGANPEYEARVQLSREWETAYRKEQGWDD